MEVLDGEIRRITHSEPETRRRVIDLLEHDRNGIGALVELHGSDDVIRQRSWRSRTCHIDHLCPAKPKPEAARGTRLEDRTSLLVHNEVSGHDGVRGSVLAQLRTVHDR